MKRLLTILLLSVSVASAQTAKTRAALYTDIDTSLASGGQITAAQLRAVLKNLTASSQNGLTDGTAALASDLTSGLATKQAADSDLTIYAGITPSANIQSFLGAADYSAARGLLGLTIGTNVQAFSANLSSFATVTPSANGLSLVSAADYAAMRTLLGVSAGSGDALVANPLSQFAATTSAQLAGVLTDETGTGSVVFSEAPTINGGNFTGNSTFGNVTATALSPTNITGATAHGQLFIGNNTSGNFTKSTLTAGNGISITNGAASITINATATGTNTGDQNVFPNIVVSGQDTVTSASTTGNLTLVAGSGMTITTNNTTKAVTFVSSGGSGAETGDVKFILDSASVPAGWGLTGANGIAAFTTPDADYKAVIKMAGTVATPTFSPAAGEVADGATITFLSATSGVTFMATTNGTDPSRTVGTAGASMVISGNTTYEVMAYKDGVYLADSAKATGVFTIAAGGPADPTLLWWKLNDAVGTTIAADAGPAGTTDGTLNSDYLVLNGSSNEASTDTGVTYGVNVITVSLWVNRASWSSGSAQMLINSNWGGGGGGTFRAYEQSGDLQVQLGDSAGAAQRNFTVSGLSTGAWHHIAIVLDSSTGAGVIKVYINGSVATPTYTFSDKSATNNFTASTFWLGASAANTQLLTGSVDDVRIYSGEVASGDVASIHTAGRQ